jgi:hypothetical protein
MLTGCSDYLLFVFTSFYQAKAQTIVIKTGSNETSIVTSTVQKFTFGSSNLSQKNTDGTTVTYNLSSQTRIIFKSQATGTLSLLSDSKFFIYPNPATETIYLDNIPVENTTVHIYRIDGKLILQADVSANNNSIDVSKLQSGLYLLKINNVTFKLIKQ